MKIREIKNHRNIVNAVRGILLLAVLALLFSSIVGMLAPVLLEIGSFTEKAGDSGTEAAPTGLEAAGPAESNSGEAFQGRGQAEGQEPDFRDLLPSPGIYAVMYALLALYYLLTAVSSRAEWKVNPKRCGLMFLCFSACAVIFLAGRSDMVFGIAALLHSLALILDHIFAIVRNHRVRKVIPRVLGILLISICVSMIIVSGMVALMYILLLTIPRIFAGIIRISFSRVNTNIIKNILRKTYAAEILFGLVLLILAFSIVLPQFEEGIPSFGDALWYCFAIVTTIGFGDFTAVTVPGRVVSVILGIYGIIVVALITSIIVNFYTETKSSVPPEEAGQPGGTDAG